MTRCRPLWLLVLSLAGWSGHAESATEVSVTDLKYGNAKIVFSKRTGSHIMRQPEHWRIKKNGTEIPLDPSSQIAYEMRLTSDGAKAFDVLRRLERPDGRVSTSVVSARNGRKTRAAFHFHEDAIPGKWRLIVAIVGIDGIDYEPTKSQGDLRVLDVSFDVFLPEGVDEVPGFHEYTGIDVGNVGYICY